jgi:hypothetical protein
MDIHRLLDEAFAGIEVTPEIQDLKEEMRANLVARAAELESTGMAPPEAARRAMAELGDVRSVVEDVEPAASGGAPDWLRHRVRPRPRYVLRAVLLAAFGVLALVPLALPAFDIAVPLAGQLAAVAVAALIGGVIVADALRQETTTNYPVPRGRAVGYGAAATVGLAGVGAGALYWRGLALPWLAAGGLMLLVAVVAFTYLGVTQTNRHKSWVVRMQNEHAEVGDRFAKDPAAAARFGIYTMVIWLVAFAAFGVLSFTVGWAWSWLALLGGVVVMMLTLTRMLFGKE